MDEEGVAMLEISGLAKEATSLFQSGRYKECVDVLGLILQRKADDLKVNILGFLFLSNSGVIFLVNFSFNWTSESCCLDFT